MNEPKYFSSQALKKLADVENQQLKHINYHYWVNTASEPVTEVLDFIELLFIDNESLMFSASELCDAINVQTIEISNYASELVTKFGNQVRIRTEDMSDFPLWEKATEYSLDEVLLDCSEAGRYYSDKLLLKFGPVVIQIEITELGLSVSENTDHLR